MITDLLNSLLVSSLASAVTLTIALVLPVGGL
jgi:hypothetical protein